MSIQNEITRLMSAKADLKSAIEEKGVPVPSATKLDGYASLVGSITTGGGTPTLQSKSVAFTPAETIQTSTVTADSGYDGLSTVNVSVDAIPSAYVIPSGSLSISANGTYNVEAFARAEVMVSGGGSDQWAGLVDGTLSEAIDYQGSISNIGRYAFASNSTISIASFPNVVSISFNAFANCSNLTMVNFPKVQYIDGYAFNACSKMTSAYFSKLTSTDSYVFGSCLSLSLVEMPLLSSIQSYMFQNCRALTSVSFPLASAINTCTFRSCFTLSVAIFSHSYSSVGRINASAFAACYNLLSLYLLGSTVYSLYASTAFSSTPISTYTTSTGGVQGSVFVPSSLYSSYVSASYWSVYSSRIVSLTDAQIQNVLTYGTHNPT